MQRLIRQLGGTRRAGEKDEHLLRRATAAMNKRLSGNALIGPRRARGYWAGEYEDIPSVHMDLARDLTFVQPIEEALDAVQAAEQYIDHLRERLLDRLTGSPRNRRADDHEGASDARPLVSAGDRQIRNSRPAVLGLLNSSSLRSTSAT